MREQVASRLLVLVAAATLLASADLFVKVAVSTPMWAFHYRNGWWVGVSLATLLGALALAFVPSTAVAAAGMDICSARYWPLAKDRDCVSPATVAVPRLVIASGAVLVRLPAELPVPIQSEPGTPGFAPSLTAAI